MMKKLALLFSAGLFTVIMFSCSSSPANNGSSDPGDSMAEMDQDEKMAWWREAKFGLFIHWGVYAVPAGRYADSTHYGEWIMWQAKIPLAEYKEYAREFNPVKYDPAAWVKIAKDAGMRYIVITSKHHDGFALYPSNVTDWDVADASPYGKDLLGPLVEEAKKAGLKIGFYYSQAQDWGNPGGAKFLHEEGTGWDDAHLGDFDAYLEDISLPQVKEIISRYPLDILWWDTPHWMNEARTKPFEEALKPRPGMIANNRLGTGKGDMNTPEQHVPVSGYSGDWETCMTMNNHWGYNAYDNDRKSSEELILKLIEICSKGGNFLLNVGPTAEGEFPEASIERLKDMGDWLKVNGESIYGTTKSPFSYLSWGAASRKGGLLNLYVTDWPENNKLHVPIKSKVAGAELLTQPGKLLHITTEDERIIIDLPEEAPDPVASVIILKLAEEPVTVPMVSSGKRITASSENPDFPASNAVDGSARNIWQPADTTGESYLEFDLETPTWIQAVGVDEIARWPRRGQHIRLEAETEKGWEVVFTEETGGRGLVKKFDPVQASRVRLFVEYENVPPYFREWEKGPAHIAEWQLYAPE